jgi:aldehyde dehydrogenase (NAD+)
VLDQNYIGGRWVASGSASFLDVLDPTTEQIIGRVADSTESDIDLAVRQAREAFPEWAAAPVCNRAALLDDLHAALARREEEFVEVLVRDVGAPGKIARRLQFGLPLAVLSHFTQPEAFPADEEIGNSLVVREPIGVVGAITPWNYPLHQTVAKLAPALLAGCTVVLKPSEVTPLAVHLLTEVMDEVGIPAGVVNVVSGGVRAGHALVAHPYVDMVSFTGSTRGGREVAATAAADVKRVALELGGKSANLVLDGLDGLDRIIRNAVGNCFLNSGQTCLALTRLLVHRDQYEQATELAGQAAAAFVVGDPADPATKLGPLTSAAHRDRVTGYIELGIAEGARLVTGGPIPPTGLHRGFFVQPTVFADVRPDMRIAREEIFGPVLCVLPFDTEQEAVEIANSTDYGLTGAVWSADPDRAMRVARSLRTGQVDINGAAFNPAAPFGGYKQSGNGRELGRLGIEEFLEVKAIQR